MVGARLQDLEGGRTFECRAKKVVNATGVWLDGFAPLGDAVGRQVHSATIQLDVDSERCWWYDDDMCNYLFEAEATSGTNMYALWASVLYILQVFLLEQQPIQ